MAKNMSSWNSSCAHNILRNNQINADLSTSSFLTSETPNDMSFMLMTSHDRFPETSGWGGSSFQISGSKWIMNCTHRLQQTRAKILLHWPVTSTHLKNILIGGFNPLKIWKLDWIIIPTYPNYWGSHKTCSKPPARYIVIPVINHYWP